MKKKINVTDFVLFDLSVTYFVTDFVSKASDSIKSCLEISL